MSKKLILSAVLSLSLTAPLVAEEASSLNTVVATVNGNAITLGHMLTTRANLPEQYQQLPDDVLWDGILEQLIQQEALANDAAARETDRVRLALENERRALLATEAVTSIAQNSVTEETLRAAYNAEYIQGPSQVEFNASHILVESEAEAAELSATLRAGGDFATAARENSTGPSGPNGGSLGWFSAGMMVEPFQVAVDALRPGEVSGPVQTQFGWHVIKLNETRSIEAPSLEEVRAELTERLQQQAVAMHLETLMDGAQVTRTEKSAIDVSALSNLGLLEE